MIRYLKQEELYKARNMYQENFPEDSEDFVSYYFSEKTRNNGILVMEEEELQVMVHLNPYKVSIFGTETELNYIVAVATDSKVRRQGKMKLVLQKAMEDMKEAGHPFTFLLPAVDPKVYTSCGFFFVKNENYQELRREYVKAASLKETMVIRPITKGEIAQLVNVSNEILKECYDVFVVRDDAYYIRKIKELACQNGQVMLLERDGKMIGSFTYGLDEQVEVQEILVKQEWKSEVVEAIENYFQGTQVVIATMNYMVCPLNETGIGLCQTARFHIREWV